MTIKERVLEQIEAMNNSELVWLENLLSSRSIIDKGISAAGVPYTGDPETDAVLDDHPDILERLARLERGEARLTPWEEVKAQQRRKRGIE